MLVQDQQKPKAAERHKGGSSAVDNMSRPAAATRLSKEEMTPEQKAANTQPDRWVAEREVEAEQRGAARAASRSPSASREAKEAAFKQEEAARVAAEEAAVKRKAAKEAARKKQAAEEAAARKAEVGAAAAKKAARAEEKAAKEAAFKNKTAEDAAAMKAADEEKAAAKARRAKEKAAAAKEAATIKAHTDISSDDRAKMSKVDESVVVLMHWLIFR